MTLLYVVLAILYLALAITVVAMWYYLGKPHPMLAKLLSPIFILFLIWTTLGFPTHFNLFPNFPVREVWCNCGNYTEIWWIDPDYKGNLTYAEMEEDCCCKGLGNFTEATTHP